MVYTKLYALVQKRMPAIPSILSSTSEQETDASDEITDSDSSATETPPPEYSSRPHSRHVSTTDALDSFTELEPLGFYDDSARSVPGLSDLPKSRYEDARPKQEDINWALADEGISFITEADINAKLGSEHSPRIARHLYLHGVARLLRGIPSDLTEEELVILRAAIPTSIHPTPQNNTPTNETSTLQHLLIAPSKPGQEPSVLQRVTATAVFYMFMLAQFLLPYIKLFIGQAYRWEREHMITQRMVSKSIKTVDSFGRTSLQFSRTVCQMNDGKVGQALEEMAVWWVQGVTGGIQQGISQGLAVNREGLKRGRRIEKGVLK